MQGDKGGGTGYPGKKKGVGGVSLERVQFEAQQAANDSVIEHELLLDPHSQYATDADLAAHVAHADPHPQYTTNAEVTALIPPPPRFVTYWKWS